MNKMWVISDLHISDNFSLVERKEIEKILNFLKDQTPENIILNGDTFDFARVYSIPKEFSASRLEKKYGLNSSEKNAVLKMQMIIDSNEYFFDTLRELLNRGFDITFLFGNHDSELRFNSVQKLIEEKIDHNQQRLHFCLRYFNDGILIEHGHQYDSENRLVYIDGEVPIEEYSFGYVTSKYFGNIIEREKRLPRNDISAGEYFVWVFKNFGFKAFVYIFQYFVYTIIVLSRSGKNFLFHNKYENDFYAIPIMSSLVMTLKRLYFIQVSIFVFLFFLLLVILLVKPVIFYFPVIGFLICLIPLFSINNKGRVDRILKDASKKLRREYGANIIVFGHNHYAGVKDGCDYLSSTPTMESDNLYILRIKSQESMYQKI